jgi:hypothetical protein
MKKLLFTLTLSFLVLAASAQTMYSDNGGSLLGFGGTIAISDGEVLVGSAPISWPSGSDPAGEVYVYRQDADGEWGEAYRLSASDGEHGDEFGRSIFVSGNLMLVGAPGTDAVYIFGKTDGEWTETAVVRPEGGLKEGAEFAGAYARGGFRTQTMAQVENNMLVTSYNADTDEGAVHVVHQMGMMWMDMGVLIEAAAWAVASSETTLFIGTSTANEGRGGIIVYEYVDSRNWVKTATIDADSMAVGAMLGRSLAASGNRLYAGAIGYEQFGAVLVYERDDSGAWNLTNTIQEMEPAEGSSKASQFGLGLNLSDNNLLIGARGTAFIQNIEDLESDHAQLWAPEGQAGRGFGVGLAISGDLVAVGAPSADYETGLATIFQRGEDGSWNSVWTALNDVSHLETIVGEELGCLSPCLVLLAHKHVG